LLRDDEGIVNEGNTKEKDNPVDAIREAVKDLEKDEMQDDNSETAIKISDADRKRGTLEVENDDAPDVSESKGEAEKKKRRTKPGKRGEKSGSVQKRMKKTSRKEFLELICRKNQMLQEMEKIIEKTVYELKNKEDKLIRLAAEFENYKKRMRREWELQQQKANAELITGILEILDNFDRALETIGDEEDHFKSGVRLIYTGFMDLLKREGLKEVAMINQPFDPQYHEAVGEVESEEIEEGSIAHIVQKGYALNDLLLRAAKVIVTKKEEE